MPAQRVATQFTDASKLLKQMGSGPIDGTKIKQNLRFSEQFFDAFKQQPDIFSAQPLLYKTRASYLHNLTFNTLVYCALLGSRAKINELCVQQLLSAVLFLYAERQPALEAYCLQHETPKKQIKNLRLVQILSKIHQQVCVQGYAVSDLLFCDLNAKRVMRRCPTRLQRLVLMAHHLSIAVTYRPDVASVSFATALRNLIQQLPANWSDDLTGLLGYPGLTPPGTVIRQTNQKPALVLAVSGDKVTVNGLNPNEQAKTQISQVYLRNIARQAGAQKVAGFRQIQQWWDCDHEALNSDCNTPIEKHFALDNPPAVLLEVQKHLISGQVNIDKLAEQISTEPAFADYLRQTATFSNRHKLPVQQVKHGLMMHGYERTNNMLIEQALLLRLNQNYFPLQQDFTQFTRLVAKVGANLALADGEFVPEQVSNLVCFGLSGLFTQPGLKTRTQWQLIDSHRFDIGSLFAFTQARNITTHALTLCKAWQQPELFYRAIQAHATLPDLMSGCQRENKFAALLGLSVLLGRQIYFTSPPTCASSDDYQRQAMALLSLDQTSLDKAKLDSLAQSHCYRAIA